jgi:hypothetical protein
MQYSVGFVLVLALGVAGCSESSGGGGTGGDCNPAWDRDCCQAPLSDFCEGSECPTWEDEVAWAEEHASRCYAFERYLYSGPCGDLRYITSGNTAVSSWGSTSYFDDSGALVALRLHDDIFNYCDETSFYIWYGSIPDCEPDRSNIWENFCKGSGFEYCASVAECGAISESECLARYNNLLCSLSWEFYVNCFWRGGTCESCAEEHLAYWEACNEAN